MFRAAYSWRFGFDIHLDSTAEIGGTPSANTVSAVISGRFLPADSTATHISFMRSSMDDELHAFTRLLCFNFFYNDILDTENHF